ncbi:MAG: hypothetical protein KDF65_10655, partial [Anaerolineae bacterium]|nr:hypothetical protein [Anaerolineae bacterium]
LASGDPGGGAGDGNWLYHPLIEKLWFHAVFGIGGFWGKSKKATMIAHGFQTFMCFAEGGPG